MLVLVNHGQQFNYLLEDMVMLILMCHDQVVRNQFTKEDIVGLCQIE
jgi:hypothetical protein